MDEKRLLKNIERSGIRFPTGNELIVSIRENLEATYASLLSSRTDYKQSRKPWMKIQIRQSKRNFRAARMNWKALCRYPQLLKAA